MGGTTDIIRAKLSIKEVAAVLSPTLLSCGTNKCPSTPVAPCPAGRGASTLAAAAATGQQIALLHLSILPLGGGTTGRGSVAVPSGVLHRD